MEPKECPECGLLNLEGALLCECGHRFVSDALLQWVRDSERAGQSREQILQQLVHGGYTPEDVQAVLGEAAHLVGRREQSSTDVGVILGVIAALVSVVVVVLIVLVLILILAWYLIYGKQASPPPPQMQEEIEQLDRRGEEQGQLEEPDGPGEDEMEEEQERGADVRPHGSVARKHLRPRPLFFYRGLSHAEVCALTQTCRRARRW